MKHVTIRWFAAALAAFGLSQPILADGVWWTDTAAGTIEMADLDGNNRQVLLDNLSSPAGLALDLVHDRSRRRRLCRQRLRQER